MFVGIGQGGIQSLDHLVSSTTFSSPPSNGLRSQAQVLLIDSELKTLNASNEFCKTYSTTSKGGSGNCWACGYSQAGLKDAVMAFRKILESMDSLPFIYLSHSLGGGTGSGLTCQFIESLYDYGLCEGSAPIISSCILPFHDGDTPLQNYNCTLSLGHLNDYVDAFFVWSNSSLLSICSEDLGYNRKCAHEKMKLQSSNPKIGSTFKAMNNAALNSMIPSFKSGLCPASDIWSIVNTIVTSPNCKLLNFASSLSFDCKPNSGTGIFTEDWREISQKMKRRLKIGYPGFHGQYPSLLTIRSSPSMGIPPREIVYSEFVKRSSVVYYKGGGSLPNNSSSISLAFNGGCISEIDTILGKAIEMKKSGAFWHWYLRYQPFCDDIFDESKETLYSILESYKVQ